MVVERRLVRRFVETWQATDVDGLVRLLAEDALLTMPPLPIRVEGAAAIGEFLRGPAIRARLDQPEALQLPTRGAHAVALYLDGVAHALMTLALDGDRITALTRFGRPELFEHFELPMNSDALDGSTSATAIKESR